MMDRRDFIRVTMLASGALVFGISCAGAPRRDVAQIAASTGDFAPNVWLTIRPDNTVLVAAQKSEMGQGVLTSHAMLVAEELDVPLESVEARSASGEDEFKGAFGVQLTGGSTSLKESWIPLRTAAAAAREMLVAAAAASWGVSPSECTTDGGEVRHAASGRAAT